MNTARYIPLLLLSLLGGCATIKNPEGEGCAESHDLPPVRLTAQQKEMLAKPHAPPSTALDYYLLLPKRYFSFLPEDEKRRMSFVNMNTLEKDYLTASHWFECDGGGFSVTIRVFRSAQGDLVAINASEDAPQILLQKSGAKLGLISVTLKKPTFWRYDGGWKAMGQDRLPSLTLEEIVDRYQNKYRAHLAHPDQKKFIYLEYILPECGETIEVVGRENFMGAEQTWATFTRDGEKFGKIMP